MTILIAEPVSTKSSVQIKSPRPRLGFLGLGWIGKNRLEAIAGESVAEITAIADASPKILREAADAFPKASVATEFEELLDADLDGVVIATPSALHAAQAIRAFEKGMAVCCQKP